MPKESVALTDHRRKALIAALSFDYLLNPAVDIPQAIKDVLSSQCAKMINQLADKGLILWYVNRFTHQQINEKASAIKDVLSSMCAKAINQLADNDLTLWYINRFTDQQINEKASAIKNVLSSRSTKAINPLAHMGLILWYINRFTGQQINEKALAIKDVLSSMCAKAINQLGGNGLILWYISLGKNIRFYQFSPNEIQTMTNRIYSVFSSQRSCGYNLITLPFLFKVLLSRSLPVNGNRKKPGKLQLYRIIIKSDYEKTMKQELVYRLYERSFFPSGCNSSIKKYLKAKFSYLELLQKEWSSIRDKYQKKPKNIFFRYKSHNAWTNEMNYYPQQLDNLEYNLKKVLQFYFPRCQVNAVSNDHICVQTEFNNAPENMLTIQPIINNHICLAYLFDKSGVGLSPTCAILIVLGHCNVNAFIQRITCAKPLPNSFINSSPYIREIYLVENLRCVIWPNQTNYFNMIDDKNKFINCSLEFIEKQHLKAMIFHDTNQSLRQKKSDGVQSSHPLQRAKPKPTQLPLQAKREQFSSLLPLDISNVYMTDENGLLPTPRVVPTDQFVGDHNGNAIHDFFAEPYSDSPHSIGFILDDEGGREESDSFMYDD